MRKHDIDLILNNIDRRTKRHIIDHYNVDSKKIGIIIKT